MQSSREPDFFVADWRICPALGRLEFGETVCTVGPRSMQVLSCLARHAPNLVSKQRLIQEVWGDGFVTEEVLSHAVWELRKAFGDEAKNPRYIQTISRRGYRLLAPVTFGVAAEPLVPGSRIAQYEILELLGASAMGEVYKARDQRLGRIVALKFLPADLARDPSARRRFLHEAQAVAQLDHPNVATIYEVGESEGGRAYLALAFYEGETLQRKLEGGPLPLPEAVRIARQIARGLAAAHQRQIVHRDVKPANVVILPDGTVKLLDFGLAKMVGATSLTRLGASPGTPAYKSPEQTRGEKVDRRSDLWALGVVLYEIVTGRQPFGGEYEQAVIYAILNETPRPLDDSVPSELAEVIDRALAKELAARYSTAEELEEDLTTIQLGEVAPRRARPSPRLNPQRKWLAGGLATLVALSMVWGVWRWRERLWNFPPVGAPLIEQRDRLARKDHKRPLAISEEFEGSYRKALALDPDNPLIGANLAVLLAHVQSQFPSIDRLEEIRGLTALAIERAPDHPRPWIARAKLLLLENNPREAEKAAREAAERDPDSGHGYTILGETLIEQGRLEESLESFRRAIEVGPRYLGCRFEYDEAEARLQKVLADEPGHLTAVQNLGTIYLMNGRFLDAIPLLRKAFELTRDPHSANSLGITYSNLGRIDKAIPIFRDAYRLDPSPAAARNLAESYEKIGQRAEAHRWYALAIDRFDSMPARGASRAELLYGRSFCAAKLGRYDEALGDIQEAIRLRPERHTFLFWAAQICEMADHREEAYFYIRKIIPREAFRSESTFLNFQDDLAFQGILESSTQ
jgi:serine/threonine-protein kinase